MAFGIQILTTTGLKSVQGVSAARVVASVEARAVSGTAVVPTYDETKGSIAVVDFDPKTYRPLVEWDEPTKTVSWSNPTTNISDSALSQNFDIYFLQGQ